MAAGRRFGGCPNKRVNLTRLAWRTMWGNRRAGYAPNVRYDLGDVVTDIVLDGALWRSVDDFYEALLPQLDAPEWHGHNLDALNDSIAHGGVNGINPPLRITIRGASAMAPAAAEMVRRFSELVDDMQAEGAEVELSVL